MTAARVAFKTPEPVLDGGAAMLDELARLLARYVAFPSDAARIAVVLWIVHCHAIDAFESTPRLALLSPEKGSGKTRTLEVLSLVVPTPMHAVNMSAAALYRVVADRQPTLLLDEADTYLGLTVAKQHEDIRGLECPRFGGHLSAWSALSGWAGRMLRHAKGIELQEAVPAGVPA